MEMERHRSNDHDAKKIYGCKKCDKKYEKQALLNRHVAQVHEGREVQDKFLNEENITSVVEYVKVDVDIKTDENNETEIALQMYKVQGSKDQVGRYTYILLSTFS